MSERDDEFESAIERLDRVVATFQRHADPAVQEGAAALVEGMRALHSEGLRRLIALFQEDRPAWERALADPLITNVLFLHDLIAPDDREAVEAALDAVRPVAHSHGGKIELIDATDGVIRLRLRGSCSGCPSSSATLHNGIEAVLRERLPGFQRIEVEPSSTVETVVFEGDRTACVVPAEKIAELEARVKSTRASVGAAAGAARKEIAVATLELAPRSKP